MLLGVENEDGSRFGEISAPLGNIDGKALLRELPIWDGVPLLACDPWKTENPQSWEVQACIHALSQVRSVVVVDMGQWNGLQDLTELRKAIRITVVELTVLGLARAKANLRAHHGSIGEHDAATQEREFLVGVQPRGTVRDHGTTAIEEAAEYLDCDITAVIKPDAKLCSELLEGLDCANPIVRTRKPSQRWRISFRKRWEKRASVMELGPLSDIASGAGRYRHRGNLRRNGVGGSRPRYAAAYIARTIQQSPSHPRFRCEAVLAAWQKARRRLPDSRRVHGGRRARARGYRTARSARRRHQHTIAGRCCAQSGIFGGKRHVSKRMDAFAGRIRGTKGQRARDRRNRSGQNHAAQSNAYAMRAGERVITVEEVRELGMLNHANHVSLVTRDANMEGKGAIGLSQLICATLRMRPDRIVVGECRAAKSWICCAR